MLNLTWPFFAPTTNVLRAEKSSDVIDTFLRKPIRRKRTVIGRYDVSTQTEKTQHVRHNDIFVTYLLNVILLFSKEMCEVSLSGFSICWSRKSLSLLLLSSKSLLGAAGK